MTKYINMIGGIPKGVIASVVTRLSAPENTRLPTGHPVGERVIRAGQG
jgi:hypothetical protein